MKHLLSADSLSSKNTLIASVIAGPALLLILALAGIAVEMRFLSDQHSLLKKQQTLTHSAAQLNTLLNKQTHAWHDFLVHFKQEPQLWQQFRERERTTFEQANQLLIDVEQSQLQNEVRAIIYALEVLRISYQQSRAEFLDNPINISRINNQVRYIDQTPSAQIEELYQKIQRHADQTSDDLRQRAWILSAIFALLLVTATVIYMRWSTSHTRKFLKRQHASHKRVQWLLHHDYLTRLLTRNRLIEEVEAKIEQKKPLYAFHFRLANIKDAAQSQGHSVQDQLIRIAARRLLSDKRPSDILARAIGEEFILIAEDDASLDLDNYARRLLRKIEADFSIAGFRYQISCSMGISHYPMHANNCSDLLRCADIAAVHGRSQRLNAPSLYSQSMTERITQKFEQVAVLKNAITDNQVRILFQPQVDLTSHRISGVEVLTRLDSPNKDLNMPDAFIPLAEETGLIHSLGKVICELAIKQLSQWQQQGYQLSMAINVSARQFEAADFSDHLVTLCQKYQVPTKNIDIELTESNYIDGHHPQLDTLRELGFKLSIDDFGTGYSNLGYLSRFVPQQLKIDKSFIDMMNHSQQQHALVESIVRLAHSQKIEVVAEGIETQRQVQQLKRMRVDIGQGYFFSRPVDAQAITQLLRAAQSPALDCSG